MILVIRDGRCVASAEFRERRAAGRRSLPHFFCGRRSLIIEFFVHGAGLPQHIE
jgi:hypothetical protein